MADDNNQQSNNGTKETGTVDYAAELKKLNDNLSSQLANLKQELNRKVTNIEQKVAPPPKVQEDENLEDLIYSNPKKAIEMIETRATQKVMGTIKEEQAKGQAIGGLINDYPELQDQTSSLFKEAVKIYEKMSPEEQNSTTGYKLAVKEAALELGVKPRHKRESQDDFSLSGSDGRPATKRRERDGELDSATEAFARMVGLDMNNKDQVERIKARSQRKNWNRYE